MSEEQITQLLQLLLSQPIRQSLHWLLIIEASVISLLLLPPEFHNSLSKTAAKLESVQLSQPQIWMLLVMLLSQALLPSELAQVLSKQLQTAPSPLVD